MEQITSLELVDASALYAHLRARRDFSGSELNVDYGADMGFEVGGPIIKNRAHFFFTYERDNEDIAGQKRFPAAAAPHRAGRSCCVAPGCSCAPSTGPSPPRWCSSPTATPRRGSPSLGPLPHRHRC